MPSARALVSDPTLPFDLLLFDLGGVLVDFAGFVGLCELLPVGLDPAAVRERWIRSPSVHALERAEIAPAEFARRFLVEWRLDLAPEELLRRFTDWNRGLYPGAAALLARVRDAGWRGRMACLSNSNPMHTPRHRQRLAPFLDRFYFSDELRLAKPDAAIFEAVLADLDLPAERIAFFDDTPLNVQAGADAGLRSFRTDGLAALDACLRSEGLT